MELLGLQHHRLPDGSPRRRIWTWLALAVAGALLFNCNAANHPPENGTANDMLPNNGGLCVPGHAGCPCSTAGEVVSCGTLESHVGDYVTCQMGESTCAGGVWGPCAGDRQIVTKSLAPVSQPSGIHVLSSPPTACGGADACDPGCFWTTPAANQVSAPGIAEVPGSDTALTLVSSGCAGLQCQVPSNCPNGTQTQLTGIVTDPSGQNPIPNAVVYIPVDPSGVLPPFSPGASCDTCAGTGTIEAVSVSTTAADGSFTLGFAPSTDLAPNAAIPVVVQAGKWRREEIFHSIPQCETTSLDPNLTRLPRSQTDGYNNHADLPRMAIVASQEDALECLLLRIGVDVNEVRPAGATPPDGGAPGQNRIDLYQGNANSTLPGNANYTGLPPETDLESSLSKLMQYDAVLLPCEGPNSNLDVDAPTNSRLTYASTVADYANAGGRIFATHRSISWLAMSGNPGDAQQVNPNTNRPNPFYGAVNWDISHEQIFTAQASIDTTIADDAGASVPYAEGQTFATWMAEVDPGSPPVTVENAAVDVASVKPPTAEWMHVSNPPYGPAGPLSFSFDTPLVNTPTADGGMVGADTAGSCGRVFFNDFHVSASDRLPGGANVCIANNDCGYNATCSPGVQPGACVPVDCQSNSDCAAGFTCGPVGQPTCMPQTHCNAGSDCRSGTCNATTSTCLLSGAICATNADCGQAEVCGVPPGQNVCGHDCQADSDCAEGESCANGRCVGCFFGTDCASGSCQGAHRSSCSATSTDFPGACKQGHTLTAQEKALEFMLFDLTSCVAPAAFNVQPLKFQPATFTYAFTAAMNCQPGETVRWRELDWNATIPGDSSITFSVQTGNAAPDGGAVQWTPSSPTLLAKATTSTVDTVVAVDAGPDADVDATVIESPQWDVALIDTGTNADGGPNAILNSQSELLLTVTLTPTSDNMQAPTLNNWRITSVCTPSE